MNILKKARTEANLTQKKASELLKMPLRTYENWEAGSVKPYLADLAAEKFEQDNQIILDGLEAVMEETYNFYLKCKERCDFKSMALWEKRAQRIYSQYVRIDGKGCVSNIQGMDTQKNNVFSIAEIMGATE